MKAFFAVLVVVLLSIVTWYCVDDDDAEPTPQPAKETDVLYPEDFTGW